MNLLNLYTSGYSRAFIARNRLESNLEEMRIRKDPVAPVVLIVLGTLAIVAIVGLTVAWWRSCRAIGKYPAVRVGAPVTEGSVWRGYCQ